MENNHNPMEDDGSLDFLKIPADETNKHFNCPETTQQKLINLTFWVCDYIEGVKTKFGSDRTLVKIKMNRDDPDRILHHAIMNILEPIWVSVFTKDTYSCIKGRGLDFVGFVFYHNQTLMRKSIKQNFCRMAARLNKKLNISARDYKQRLCSWYGWAKVSNSKHLLKTIIKSQFYDTFVLRCKAV